MYEFKNTYWVGQIVQFNYSGNNNPGSTKFSTTCFTAGCTGHKRTLAGTAYYTIELRRDLARLSAGHSFWCPFTLGQIIDNLEDISEVIPIKFTVEETEEIFKIRLEISNKLSNRVHFYVLTRVRYLYEYPQCVLFNDAYKLKELDRFSKWNLQSLYGLIVSSIPIVRVESNNFIAGRSWWYDNYHSIPLNLCNQIPEILSNEELKNRDLNFSSLNQIYRNLYKVPIKIPYDKELFSSLAYWKEKIGFNLRLPYYLENATLYDDSEKKIANKVEIEGFEEAKKQILNIKIDLLSKKEAEKLVNDDYNRRQREANNKVPLNGVDFNRLHPRDKYGRFIKRVTV